MLKKWLAIMMAAGALTACGGGGGGGAPSTSTANNTANNVSAPSTGTGAATISWLPPTQNTDGSTLTDLTGYKILYGKNSNSLAQTVQITNPSVSTYVLSDLSTGTWYFTVKAVTRGGMESDASNIASKTI